MPTGYTAGIIDGKITSFPQFAKQCARNFGALIHMRDEPFDKEWEPRVPSDYHSKKIAEANAMLEETRKISDEELLLSEQERLEEQTEYHVTSIERGKQTLKELQSFIEQAKNYAPPTKDHNGIAEFMIQQLQSTIEHDGDFSYHERALKELEEQKATLNADKVRFARMEKAHKDLAYHTKEHEADILRCKESNAWVTEFFKSLEQ